MKKLLSLFLVLALAFSLCVGALAEETAAKAVDPKCPTIALSASCTMTCPI